MVEQHPVLVKMRELIEAWELENDRRLIFLTCYLMMTQNVLLAIDTGEFEDGEWVARLMETFASHYFKALDAYQDQVPTTPQVWKIAFNAVKNSHVNSLQNMVLGVNAHINYDLVLALSEVLEREWAELTPEGRQIRYRDHNRVNHVIHQTIDAVQDQVIGRYDPEFSVLDKLVGPLDEWMTTLLISDWREEVWRHATSLLNEPDSTSRQGIMHQVEKISLDRARDILGEINLSTLLDFI
ncbi:MAG TPA: DUF5995 family protein [Anaerolineaceae bacterium]|nr:DUF5995 family protein [Anaerolineaceae bacterium]